MAGRDETSRGALHDCRRGPDRRAARRRLVLALIVAAAWLAVRPAAAYEAHPRVYYDAASCREAHVYADAVCANAYANAKAEFDEKAPRFAGRAECERRFRRCMIGDFSRGGRRVTFMPQMRGFVIESGPRRRVVPVADGGGAEGLFRPRPVDRVDAFVSDVKTEAAQKAWKLMTAPPGAGAAGVILHPADDGANEPAAGGPVKTYPLSPAMLQDLKTRERLYGTSQKR